MRRDVQEIVKMTPQEKQVMMFSATLPKELRAVCKKFMQDVSKWKRFLWNQCIFERSLNYKAIGGCGQGRLENKPFQSLLFQLCLAYPLGLLSRKGHPLSCIHKLGELLHIGM